MLFINLYISNKLYKVFHILKFLSFISVMYNLISYLLPVIDIHYLSNCHRSGGVPTCFKHFGGGSFVMNLTCIIYCNVCITPDDPHP